MAGKLTKEQKAEILRRYECGAAALHLAADYGVAQTLVSRYVKRAGLTRSPAHRAALAHKNGGTLDLLVVSSEQWAKLYWGPEKPSMKALARRFGVADETIRRHLSAAGVSLRNGSAQCHIEYALGRNQRLKRGGGGRLGTDHRTISPQCRAAALAAPRRDRLMQHGHCSWCGVPVERPVVATRPVGFFGCCRAHRTHYHNWRRNERTDQPRPLILSRLRDLYRQHPYKAMLSPRSALEKAAETIGAGEPEIEAVLTELTSPPRSMLPTPPAAPVRPKGARAPLRAEEIGAVGQALLKAQQSKG